MAKVRKPYNKLKQLTRAAEYFAKDVVVAYTDSLEGCVLLDIKRERLIPPESKEGKLAIASISRPHQWSCFIAVFGRTAIDEYMKAEQIFTPGKYFQADLAPIFEEHHTELMKSVPDHHRCGVGWLASPKGKDFTEKEAGRLFQMLQAWD